MARRTSPLVLGALALATFVAAPVGALQPVDEQRDGVYGLHGGDAAKLSAAISADLHDDDSADAIVVATSARFPDLLAGGAVVGALDAPLLLTSGDPASFDYLDSSVSSEIERVANGATTAYILGGTGAVSSDVEADIRSIPGIAGTRRLAGDDRIRTAIAIADFVVDRTSSTDVLVARGFGGAAPFADALAGGAFAASTASPILLTETAVLSAPTRAWIEGRRSGRSFTILGGTAAVSDGVEQAVRSISPDVGRVAGADRYATAVAIAQSGRLWARSEPCAGSVDRAIVANGNAFQAATLAAAYESPVLLSNGPNTDTARGYLDDASCKATIAVLGAGDIDARGVAEALGAALGREQPAGSRDNPLPLGTPALTAEGWELSVTDANLDADDELEDESSFYSPPDDGNQYVLVSVRATNTTEDTQYFNSLGLNLAAGSSYTSSYSLCGGTDDDLPSDRDVPPGSTISGDICFEVPEETIDSLVAYWNYTGEYTPYFELR